MDDLLKSITNKISALNLEDDFFYEKRVSDANAEEIKKIHSDISALVTTIYETIGYDQTTNIPIGAIMKRLNFEVITTSFNETRVSGMLSISDENTKKNLSKNLIMLNENDNKGHQRFTVAHELAHFIFDSIAYNNTDYYEAYYVADSLADTNLSLREYRANKFAAELLMPKKTFTIKYTAYSSLFEYLDYVVVLLHLDFGVSKTAVMKRIQELKLGE